MAFDKMPYASIDHTMIKNGIPHYKITITGIWPNLR